MIVRHLMQSEVVTLPVGATLDLVDGLMRVERVRHIPIVSGKSLAGLVSQRDLLRAAVSNARRMEPGAEKEWLRGIPVEDVMTTEVLFVHPEASIGSAVEMMLKERIGCLPVVEAGELVGLLSETDCLRYLGRMIRNDEDRRSLE